MSKAVLAVACLWVGGLAATTASAQPPHLEPEMTGVEYRALNAHRRYLDAGDLQVILDMGQRNLAWIDVINAQRGAGLQLQLSTPETATGHSIDDPHYYNRELIKQAFNVAVAAVPTSMRQVLAGESPLPADPGVADGEFLRHARRIDVLYQDASRWLAMEPYLDELAEQSYRDVRSLVTLEQEPLLEAKLRAWAGLTASEQQRLNGLLVGLCRNAGVPVDTCQSELTAALPAGAFTFYSDYLPQARALWQSFFGLYPSRPDITWTKAEPDSMHVPFLRPEVAKVGPWLRDNIEDEWRQDLWQLRLDFTDQQQARTPHVEFKLGATPHVSGADTITMDSARNLDEYLNRWAIRHEFGHVLGFPDCYVEYYEKETGRMVNYQLDLTNLMCSRRGHLQPQHVRALRKAYFR